MHQAVITAHSVALEGPKEKVRGGHGIWAETLGVQCGRQIGETRAEAGTAVGG